MSLYNTLFGVNPLAKLLLKMLELKREDVGRFRDIFYNKKEGIIILYTRNGGGNREEYQHIFDALKANHPNYIKDYDDDFDNTYAYIDFSVPEQFKDMLNKLVSDESKVENIRQKFDHVIKDMQSMNKEQMQKDKRFSGMFDVINEITETMEKTDKEKV